MGEAAPGHRAWGLSDGTCDGSVQLWQEKNPALAVTHTKHPRRRIVCDQKGGVGKTAMAGGLAKPSLKTPTPSTL